METVQKKSKVCLSLFRSDDTGALDEMTALSSCSETQAQTHRRQKVGQRATKIQILVTALRLEIM
jgi:hypothetical protein